MRLVILLIVAYFFNIGMACKKKCIPESYSFSINMSTEPDRDSININDTLWVQMNEEVSQVDISSGQIVDFSEATRLGTTIQAVRFTGGSFSNPGAVNAVTEFEVLVKKGVRVDNPLPAVLLSIDAVEEDRYYKIKCGIVPKQTGTYAIAISNSGTTSKKNDECFQAGFNITFANTNQHLYFYEQNRPGYTPSEYERTHMYCFKVK